MCLFAVRCCWREHSAPNSHTHSEAFPSSSFLQVHPPHSLTLFPSQPPFPPHLSFRSFPTFLQVVPLHCFRSFPQLLPVFPPHSFRCFPSFLRYPLPPSIPRARGSRALPLIPSESLLTTLPSEFTPTHLVLGEPLRPLATLPLGSHCPMHTAESPQSPLLNT